MSISDDATCLAGSFDDSIVRLWSLTNKKLQSMKPSSQLSMIPSSAGQQLQSIMVTLICTGTLRGCDGADIGLKVTAYTASIVGFSGYQISWMGLIHET